VLLQVLVPAALAFPLLSERLNVRHQRRFQVPQRELVLVEHGHDGPAQGKVFRRPQLCQDQRALLHREQARIHLG